MGQTTSFDVVRIICQINLCFMVNTTRVFADFLLLQDI